MRTQRKVKNRLTGGIAIIASDTAYNIVPKGRNMHQSGTQTCILANDLTTKTPFKHTFCYLDGPDNKLHKPGNQGPGTGE